MVVLLLGCRQVVKATDSDSVTVGSNPTTPAKRIIIKQKDEFTLFVLLFFVMIVCNYQYCSKN